MKKLFFSILLTALLIFNVQNSEAGNVLGKVMVYSPSSTHADIYPLLSGNKTMYGNKTVIKLGGASLLADKGSVVEAVEEDGIVKFKLEKGEVSFRVQPDRFRVCFLTPHGEITSPKIVTASTSYIIGTISVTDSTVLEVSEGVLEAKTLKGTTSVREGQAIVLAQSDIGHSDIEADQTQPNKNDIDNSIKNTLDEEVPTNVLPDELVQASSQLPIGLLELLSMVGEHATAESELLPQGTVTLSGDDKNVQAKVVDYALRPSNKKVSKGDPVKVVCISANENSGTEVLVRAQLGLMILN